MQEITSSKIEVVPGSELLDALRELQEVYHLYLHRYLPIDFLLREVGLKNVIPSDYTIIANVQDEIETIKMNFKKLEEE